MRSRREGGREREGEGLEARREAGREREGDRSGDIGRREREGEREGGCQLTWREKGWR